jgi:hypothetical protein
MGKKLSVACTLQQIAYSYIKHSFRMILNEKFINHKSELFQ